MLGLIQLLLSLKLIHIGLSVLRKTCEFSHLGSITWFLICVKRVHESQPTAPYTLAFRVDWRAVVNFHKTMPLAQQISRF